MLQLAQMIYLFGKEVIVTVFTVDSPLVKSIVMLIMAGKLTMEEVPDVGNLRATVELALTK